MLFFAFESLQKLQRYHASLAYTHQSVTPAILSTKVNCPVVKHLVMPDMAHEAL